MSEGGTWKPDAETLRWCLRWANEKRISNVIRDDVRERTANIPPDTDEYWTIVSEVAIESILFDLVRLAEEEGTSFDDGAAADG